MEIERKFLIKDLHSLPFSIEAYPHRELEQAYLCTGPVVRIRKDDEQYFLTYKSKGLMIREEYNLPLNRQAYLHLREKADGRIIQKTRYVIPLDEVTDSSFMVITILKDGTIISVVHVCSNGLEIRF